MKTIILSIVCLLSFSVANAQFTVTGKLIDEKSQSLGFANIILNAADSSPVTGIITDKNGDFKLETDKNATYFITISMIGYQTYMSPTFELNSQNPTKNFETLTLKEGGVQLNEASITAEKPIFERQIDRTVINLENRVATAGATALEVLERSPSVIVDRGNNSISMLGKDGVNVMINDKLSYMPTSALVSLLDGMDANNIIKIELITTPPANFDAEGNAGYINIVLKENPFEGLNGNYSLSVGYGRGETINGSINLNYRKDKVNIFGSYSHLRNAQEQRFEFTSAFGTGNDLRGTSSLSERNPIQSNHNGRLGLDYEVSSNTTIGVLFAAYDNRWDMDAINTVEIYSDVDTFSSINNIEENYWQHLQTNFNVAHKFENGGSLNFDVDYLIYNNQNPTDYTINYLDANQNNLGSEDLFSTKNTPFNIQVTSLDYQLPFKNESKLSTGLKYVRFDFENDVLVQENNITNSNLTSVADLQESIFAAYAQYEFNVGEKLSFKGGLRYEHTDTELNTDTEEKVVDRNYGNLFPSIYGLYRINQNSQFGLSYSRRINRPSFSNLAPFVIFFDPNTFVTGNTALQPGIADAIQADFNIKSISISAQYTYEDNAISRYQSQFNPDDFTRILTAINMRNGQTFTTSVSFPLTITKWWKMRLFSMYIWNKNNLVDVGGDVTIAQSNGRFNGINTFSLPNDFNIELSGFYTTGLLRGNNVAQPLWLMNIGIQKRLKNGARLTFNINDMFNSLMFQTEINIPELNIRATNSFDFSQRTFKITYAASFGKKRVKASRNRNSSNDEKQRVN